MTDDAEIAEQTSAKSKKKGCLYRFFRASLIGLLLLVGCGVLYEQRTRVVVARRYPPEGDIVEVDGRNVHIRVAGDKAPTVLFEPGGAAIPGAFWGDVEQEVSTFAKVIGYDKSGLGWSDATDTARTSENLCQELYALLEGTDEDGPFVLVGSSLGGIHVRVFADRYPDLVAGMVLVDSSHPEQIERIPELADEKVTGMPRWKSLAYQVAANTGLLRLGFGNDSAAMAFLPQSLDAVGGEFRAVMESFEQAKAATGIGEKPLVVICAGHPPKGTPAELVGKFSLWQDMQKDLLSLSSNSRFVVAEDSSHGIQSTQPDVVVQAIRDVVEAARNGTTLSAAEAATTQ